MTEFDEDFQEPSRNGNDMRFHENFAQLLLDKLNDQSLSSGTYKTSNIETSLADRLSMANRSSAVAQSIEDKAKRTEIDVEVSITEVPENEESESMPNNRFTIKDNSTGATYDIRNQQTAMMLSEAAKQYTRITDSEKPWEEWWTKKQEMNLELQAAAENADVPKLKDLLDVTKYGDMIGDVNGKGLDDYTSLHLAASEGHEIVVKILISAGANVNQKTSTGRTALHIACFRGHLPILKLLLLWKSDLNVQDKDGYTPCHILSENGNYTCLEFLLKHHPDLTLKNVYGETVFDIAATVELRELIMEFSLGGDIGHRGYSRTVIDNVVLHNNRADMIKALMFKAKYLTEARSVPEKKEEIVPVPEKAKRHPRKVVQIIDASKKFLEKFEEKRESKIVEEKKAEHFEEAHADKPEIEPKKPLAESGVNPDDFEIINLIGKGAFGEVYLVKYIKNGVMYAMKVLSKRSVFSQNLLKYTRAERNVLSYTKHPFIVGLDFAFQTSESLFLVMEYCPGGDLSHLIRREKRLREDVARIYAAETLLALEDLHRRDIIFRDLKPDNVVLDEEGHARVTDFGLSKEGAKEAIASHSFCGSIAYLAPEIIRKSGHGKPVDWYLLGLLIYEMLVGLPPYFATNREQLLKNIENAPLKLPIFLSSEAKNIICNLINRNPFKRLGSGPGEAEEIKSHPWFKSINWDVAMERGLKPPKPFIKSLQAAPVPKNIFSSREKNVNYVKDWSFVASHPIQCFQNFIKQ